LKNKVFDLSFLLYIGVGKHTVHLHRYAFQISRNKSCARREGKGYFVVVI
jgi:hypothetical protein